METFEFRLNQELLCVVCAKNIINESIIVVPTPSDYVPDQCNCDLNSYKDYRVEGGRLFTSRPPRSTFSRLLSGFENPEDGYPLFGGICDECLNSKPIKRMMAIGAIKF